MTRAAAVLSVVAGITLATCAPIVQAQGDDCPPEAPPTSTTVAPAPTTTLPPIVGPADPIPEPHPVVQDYCVDTDGDGAGAFAISAGVCFTDPAVELWIATVYSIVNRYNVSVAAANRMLIDLLT